MKKLLLASSIIVNISLLYALYQSDERRSAFKNQIIKEDVRKY